MNVGDLLHDTRGTNMLWMCTAVDFQLGVNHVRQITDDQAKIMDDVSPAVMVVIRIGDKRFTKIPWLGTICNRIMMTRSLPMWVTGAVQTSPLPQQAPSQPQGSTGYPIGTIIMGTGKAMNVWIVNKDNTRDISLLWDGRQGRFATNELERTDRLIAGSHTPVKSIDVETFIETNWPAFRGKKIVWPTWARFAPRVGFSPVVSNALIKANIITPYEKKTVDSKQVTCDHRFQSYVGITEVYDYCQLCDFKIRAKQ